MKNEDLNYEELIEDYKKGKAIFSVDLSLARKFLMDNTIYSDKYKIWCFLTYFLFPFLILVMSIVEMGIIYGILYSIIAFIFFMDISGSASINFKQAKTTIFIFIAIGLTSSVFFKANLKLNFWLTLMQYISVYCFYVNIGNTIINKFLLIDKKMFLALYNDIFFIKKIIDL